MVNTFFASFVLAISTVKMNGLWVIQNTKLTSALLKHVG